jgi:SAM-dependent methyltransferase
MSADRFREEPSREALRCRFCSAPLTTTFVDLGLSPLANAYVPPEARGKAQLYYPLHARVCDECLLVQVEAFETPEGIFGNYAYFSSFAESWLVHARDYAARMIDALALGVNSRVVEIASNDGYLLRNFVTRGIPALGIEPARNVAEVAIARGVPTRAEFFGTALARQLRQEGIAADLLVANNVLAHVPDLNDFVAGMAIVLADDGVITVEFPHLLNLIEQNQFDTIYHEHFSYFSFATAEKVFARHGITLYHVEELPTHGGSLRIFGCHTGRRQVEASVGRLKEKERRAGLDRRAAYLDFGERVKACKRDLLEFLIRAKREGLRIAAYGAPAKGNTLLNYCGIGTDFIDYTVDRNPAKQGTFLPGSLIPVHSPERITETRPDYLLILPWNLRDEIMEQMSGIRAWGGRFVVPIPRVEVLP